MNHSGSEPPAPLRDPADALSSEPDPLSSPPDGETPSRLRIDMLAQPDDITCGPTCLHAVYRYFGDERPLPELVREIPQLAGGGTLASHLGSHALRRGYKARLYTYDLKTFDPTWFPGKAALLSGKLEAQMQVKPGARQKAVSEAYIEFLRLGGLLRFEDLTRRLVRHCLNRRIPIVAGLSSTYLYRSMREIPETNRDDDVRGEPGGHFVVLHGYDPVERQVLVADPYRHHPFSETRRYEAPIDRVVCAILLGVMTSDGNLLVIEPRPNVRKREGGT